MYLAATKVRTNFFLSVPSASAPACMCVCAQVRRCAGRRCEAAAGPDPAYAQLLLPGKVLHRTHAIIAVTDPWRLGGLSRSVQHGDPSASTPLPG